MWEKESEKKESYKIYWPIPSWLTVKIHNDPDTWPNLDKH